MRLVPQLALALALTGTAACSAELSTEEDPLPDVLDAVTLAPSTM